ncbi:tlg2 [Candida theae]|uniref:Tlg2 n=1 Tax=Candida theae TaxID=1198502 RepID=A0AAD5FY48_9ASCO|nr:tlg2 [Candida theae]KAI5957622.1 tlg2 [Candida theae]
MFRDRTKLFLSYRRTTPRDAPHRRPFKDDVNDDDNDTDSLFDSEQDNLIISSRKHQQQGSSKLNSLQSRSGKEPGAEYGEDIEMKPMIPTQFEIAKDLDICLTVIDKQTQELNSLYKQLIIINKSSKKKVESQIEEYSFQILQNFEKCYIGIKKFEYLTKNHERLQVNYTAQDLNILTNMKKNYANKIQQHLLVFRNLQNNYMNFLRDDDDEFDLLLNEKRNQRGQGNDGLKSDNIEELSKEIVQSTSSQQQQQQQQTQVQIQQSSNDQYLEQREREINKLAMGILEISTMFKEMETMVIDQGTMLDRIDYNLTNTVHDLKTSEKELIKAKTYQKRTTKCKIIFFLVLCVFALLMILMLRPGGGGGRSHDTGKVSEKPEQGLGKGGGDGSSGKPPLEVNHPDSPIDGSKPIDVDGG